MTADDILKPDSSTSRNWEPKQLLGSDNWESFRTLGEEATTTVQLPVRFGTMEFRDEATREVMKSFSYAESPIDAEVGSLFWRPAEILVLVGTEGSMGSPLLRESTGILALDQFVIREIKRIANLRLVPQGYYRVVFGP